MCGIAGIFSYSNLGPPVNAEELLSIREAMVNRGPDGKGIWLSPDNKIGLAHRRLSIIDLSSAAAQPMSTRDGFLRIVFNGEIYNYKKLTKELKNKGYIFQTNSDTEVLLYLYAEYGTKMVEHIRGMYAFGIWDEKKQGLFLARDPFGIKPLYYSNNGSTLRFASQVKALLRSSEIDREPQPAAHVGFYLWGHVPETYTLYKGINSVPAGATLWINLGGNQVIESFFKFCDEISKVDDQTVYRDGEVQEILGGALRDSVSHHLVADVDVGMFLSSGLDSSVLTALATESGEDKLNTITLGFEEYKNTEHDETILAKLIAEHYSTNHITRLISKSDFNDELDNLLNAMDQPCIDGVNSYFVNKVAKEAGMKVALSGIGGDELFAGYSSFRDIPLMVNIFGVFNKFPLIGRTFRGVSAPLLRRFTSPKYAGLLEYGGSYSGAYLLRKGLFMPWELPNILDGEILKEGWRELQPLIRLEETIRLASTDHLKVTMLELSWYMRNQLLRDADWAGMAHSLEIRVPLVDISLFRNLLPLLSRAESPTKRDMVQVVKKKLPQDVLTRAKTGFSIPTQEWLFQKCNIKERGLRGWAKYCYKEYLDCH